MSGTLGGLPALSRRKVGTTSSHHGPYVQGDTRATMPGTARREPARGSQSLKAGLSSDCSLQLDCMKPESLVIADQPRRGEYVPGPCTHRPSRHGSWRDPKSSPALSTLDLHLFFRSLTTDECVCCGGDDAHRDTERSEIKRVRAHGGCLGTGRRR